MLSSFLLFVFVCCFFVGRGTLCNCFVVFFLIFGVVMSISATSSLFTVGRGR